MPETSLITILQLTVVLFFLLAMVSILWSTIRYGMPPMPSNKQACQTMLDFVPEPTPKIMFDLGSGWGGFAYQLAQKYPNSTIYGYECSMLPFLFSKFFRRRENLHFRFQDFQKIIFPADSILFTYLYPAGMRELSKNPKLRDCWLCSNYFALEKETAFKQKQLNDTFHSIIYLYRID